mgnify:CR=1 FL=1
MNNPVKPLQLLRDGFKNEFADYVFESDEYIELLMKLSIDFVDEQLDVIQDEDNRLQLAMMLMDSLTIKGV